LIKLKQINKTIGLNYRKVWTLKDLSVTQIATIKLYLPDLSVFDADLKKLISTEYDKFFELRNYKRFRFVLKLPVRGQRTRSNAKTAKKRN
jgi:small subunit ribosomal protein S13